MDNCRVCKHSMPQYQTFCSRCGVRQIVAADDTGRKSILSRLKGFFDGVFYEVFRSDEEKEFDAYNPSWSFDAAIPKLESIIKRERSNPRIRAKLAIFYACAGNERLGLWEPRSSSPLGKLRSSHEAQKAKKAKEILSWVSELRQLGEEEFSPYDKAWTGLDEALDGSLSLYDKAINMDPTYHGGYSDRARAFQEVADGILEAYGIQPYHRLISFDSDLKGKLVRCGSAELGICIKQETPDLNFAVEVLRLYEQAIKDYKQALKLDPTDTTCCVELSHVLRQLGRKNEAADYLNRALAILNKALIADTHDERSYSERAQVFEESGKIELAISDLERLLTLSTSKFDLDLTRRKIEELRKGKAARGG